MVNKNELKESAVSSINLAIEQPDAYFLSDNDKTSLYAINIGLNVIGTTRVIADATVKGVIKSIEEMVDVLHQLKDTNDSLISDEMITDIVAVVENRIKLKKQKN